MVKIPWSKYPDQNTLIKLLALITFLAATKAIEIEWEPLSPNVTPNLVSGSAWIYLKRQFFIYENQGCDRCIRNIKPPYLPPLRGVHVTYDDKTSDYLCGACVRSQLTRWPVLFWVGLVFRCLIGLFGRQKILALILLCDLVQIAGLLLALLFTCPSTILIFCLSFHVRYIAHARLNWLKIIIGTVFLSSAFIRWHHLSLWFHWSI